MAIRPTLALSAVALLVSVAGCAPQVQPAAVTTLDGPPPSEASVNPDYASGRIVTHMAEVPTLADLQEVKAAANQEASSPEDRLRSPALRDAALTYGAQGGLAWGSRRIDEDLQVKAANLTRTYQFNRFLIKGPGGVTVLPPVISESRGTYEQSDAGKTLRVADTFYQIITQAKFTAVAPMWQAYLVRTFKAPGRPPEMLLPKNAAEREVWRRYVAEGWDQGIRQSEMVFHQDLARLERDFTGMARYAQLLETHQVSPPVVASQEFGTTGTGEDMRVNDTAVRITADPRLNVQNPKKWLPPVSDLSPAQASVPPGGKGIEGY